MDISYKSEFDLDLAKFFLEISFIMYDNNNLERMTEKLSTAGLKLCSFIEKDNQEAVISCNDDIIVVSFPGTDVTEKDDILVDLNFFTTPTDVGRVNRGFYSVYKKLKFDVYRSVLSLRNEKERPVYWVGHSLGGSLAILFATFYKSGTVYTFGAPKVGDEKFCRISDSLISLHRVTNIKDIFVFLPPWILGYKHSGERVEFAILEDVKTNTGLMADLAAYGVAALLQIFSSFVSFIFSSVWWVRDRFEFHHTRYYRKLLADSVYKITPSPYKLNSEDL